VGTPFRQREVGPRGGPKANLDAFKFRGGAGGNDQGLGLVYAQAGDLRKFAYEGEGRVDVGDGGGSDGEVIGKGERSEGGKFGKIVEEGVVGNNKEEGREGTALFNAPGDLDPVSEPPSEEGSHLHTGEGPINKVLQPTRKFCLGQNVVDPVMVDRVEGFGRVK